MLLALFENPDGTWSMEIRDGRKISRIEYKDWDTAVRECNRAMRLRHDAIVAEHRIKKLKLKQGVK